MKNCNNTEFKILFFIMQAFLHAHKIKQRMFATNSDIIK